MSYCYFTDNSLIMKQLKLTLFSILLSFILVGCNSFKTKTAKEKPVVISNEALAYEIIIIDQGFTLFLKTQARNKNYYSESYLKNKNRNYVIVWNSRVRNPQKYNTNIYENIIEYNPAIDYGLDVNYKLFWYFKFAEQKYRMSLNN